MTSQFDNFSIVSPIPPTDFSVEDPGFNTLFSKPFCIFAALLG